MNWTRFQIHLEKIEKMHYESEERLKSLHNSFSYSINSLSPEQKRLLPLLTVFLSPFPAEAVKMIFIHTKGTRRCMF